MSILWRLGLTFGVLGLLASCGLAQSTSIPPPTSHETPAASPPPATGVSPIALTTHVTPSPLPLPSSSVPSQAARLTPTVFNQQRLPRLTVTLADDGKTITLVVGDQFLLDLNAPYSWQVTVADKKILKHTPSTSGKDSEGTYEATMQGTTDLTATGTPVCYNSIPRCLMPSRLFTLHVNVK